jgi:hypothetical protein
VLLVVDLRDAAVQPRAPHEIGLRESLRVSLVYLAGDELRGRALGAFAKDAVVIAQS